MHFSLRNSDEHFLTFNSLLKCSPVVSTSSTTGDILICVRSNMGLSPILLLTTLLIEPIPELAEGIGYSTFLSHL